MSKLNIPLKLLAVILASSAISSAAPTPIEELDSALLATIPTSFDQFSPELESAWDSATETSSSGYSSEQFAFFRRWRLITTPSQVGAMNSTLDGTNFQLGGFYDSVGNLTIGADLIGATGPWSLIQDTVITLDFINYSDEFLPVGGMVIGEGGSVPEPSTYALLFGMASLAVAARRRLG